MVRVTAVWSVLRPCGPCYSRFVRVVGVTAVRSVLQPYGPCYGRVVRVQPCGPCANTVDISHWMKVLSRSQKLGEIAV